MSSSIWSIFKLSSTALVKFVVKLGSKMFKHKLTLSCLNSNASNDINLFLKSSL